MVNSTSFPGTAFLATKVWMLGSWGTDLKANPAFDENVMLLGSNTPMLCVGSKTWGLKVNEPPLYGT